MVEISTRNVPGGCTRGGGGGVGGVGEDTPVPGGTPGGGGGSPNHVIFGTNIDFLVSILTLNSSPMSFLVPISTLNHEISIFWV